MSRWHRALHRLWLRQPSTSDGTGSGAALASLLAAGNPGSLNWAKPDMGSRAAAGGQAAELLTKLGSHHWLQQGPGGTRGRPGRGQQARSALSAPGRHHTAAAGGCWSQ